MSNSDDPKTDVERGATDGNFPWALYASIAMRGLAWLPETFWQSTPRELCMAFAPRPQMSRPFDRATFDLLQRSFPDEGQSQQL